MSDSAVKDFYKNRSIFITGATGFLGKVLLEKLLRSCPQIERIYLLIRPKGNDDVSARMKALLSSSVFSNIRQSNKSLLDKVEGIEGDALFPNLGISLSDKERLLNDVSIVFHVAASIKFNDTLKYATEMNVKGTMKVVELCKQMRKLKVMVHVSTAFTNCNRKDVREEIYPSNLEPYRLLALSDWMDEEVLETISPKLVGDRITTYHMTKSITEKILQDESENLPIIIVRPSVVVGAFMEPMPGWTESLYHINGILVAAGRGVLRVLNCDPDTVVDVIPVDFVSNLLVACPSEKSTNLEKNGLKVYNLVSGADQPLTYRELRDYSVPALRKNPLMYPLWYPNFSLIKCGYLAAFISLILHIIPAIIVDKFMATIGMKPRLRKVMRRIEKSQSISDYFLRNDFTFCNKNVKDLWKNLSSEDQEEFCFDVSRISWIKYFEKYCLGCKQFVVKEDMSTLPKARFQMKIMKFIYYFLTWSVILGVFYACFLSYDMATVTTYKLYYKNY